MKKALKDLYYGNFDGFTTPPDRIPGYNEARHKAIKKSEKLSKHLNNEAKELFSEYSDMRTDMEICTGQADFVHGFQLGARLMIDVLIDRPEEPEE